MNRVRFVSLALQSSPIANQLVLLLPSLLIAAFTIGCTLSNAAYESGPRPRSQEADNCTTGSAMGNATTDGRPFSWKNRDGSGRHRMWYVASAGTYNYLAVGNADGLKMGVNEAGLSLQNSLILDIPSPGYTYENNTAFKTYCLSECGSVADVRQAIIEDTSGLADHWPPPSICPSFSDAHGYATTFELGAEVYYEYDPTNPTRLAQFPKQFVARANASHQNPDGTDDDTTGGNRYITARNDMQYWADNGGLNVTNWINEISRHGEPGVDSVEMPSRSSTRAVMLVHGVNEGEDPRIVTAWIGLGNPDYTCFVPTWVAQQDTLSPWVASTDPNNSIAGLAEQLYGKRDDQQYDQYINGLIRPMEDNIIEAVGAARAHWFANGFDLDEATRIHMEAADTAWHTMNAMNEGSGRALNVTPSLTAINASAHLLQVTFNCVANDADGSIVAYDWDFGDGISSTSANPIHTYASAGTYLVRCRVVDSGGSRNSKWKYITVSQDNSAPAVDAGADLMVTLPAAASLDGTVIDDRLPDPPGMVTTLWSQVSGPSTVILADAAAVDTTASFTEPGSYVLRLTADDGELTASDEVTVSVFEEPGQVSTLEVRVLASSDDAEEAASGAMDLTSTDLELVVYYNEPQEVGMRFNGITIPQGATITNGFIQFKVDETKYEDPVALTIEGEASDSAATFTSTRDDISTRPRTAAAVSWAPVRWTTVGDAGPDQQTPDIAPILQEIVDREGWMSGNSVVIIITGQGTRTAESYNGDQAGAPLLHVEYTTGPPNNPPQAEDDAYSTAEDIPLNVAAAGILDNDTDADGDALTASLVSNVSHGTLTLNANGSFSYTPEADYSGPDSFAYRASDGQADSNMATVSLTVTPVNDAPVAENDAYSTAEDTPLSVAAPGVLGNDGDVEGHALSASLVANVSNGSLTLNSNGSFSYTPNAGFVGSDSFTYRANDGSLDSNTATVSLIVTPANDAPVAENDAYSTAEDSPLSVAAPGVLGNDNDVDGDTLSAVLASGVSHGTLTLNAGGAFSYTPEADYSGPDSFTYRANDGWANSNVATVSLTVNAVNDPPVAENDAYDTDEDTILSVAAPGVLGNDSDVEGNPLSAVLASDVSHGTLALNADGSFSYTPLAGFSGPDSFTYLANDGLVDSNLATVSIAVSPSAPEIVEVRVAANADDAEEAASGAMDLGSTDLELVNYSTGLQKVGMRFNGIGIPQGGTITNAFIQFKVDETKYEDPIALTIEGEDVDNAATFTSTRDDISTRPRTAAAVSWAPVRWTIVGEAGPDQRTPDISPILQEIVDREGWSSGNSVAIIITGQGTRTAESYNGDQTGAPLLHVEYYRSQPNQPPTVTISSPTDGATFAQGHTISFSGSAYDSEDGDLTENLSWTSSLDNEIGTGNSFPRTDLSIGVHTIGATVTDSDGLSGSDQIGITVTSPSGNLPPIVSAGTDQTIGLFDDAILDGTVIDDGLPDPPGSVTTTWTQVSGPGTVAFADAGAEDTMAGFSVAGVYVLQLGADDGELTASDQLTVTVTAASIIQVPEDQPTIQAGINAAQDGDWVLVSPGTYYEALTLAGKTITLASQFHTTQDPSFIEQTIIDGGGSAVVTVDSSVGPETKIIGFTIQNGGKGINASARLQILNNRVIGNTDGIDYEGGGGICRNNLFEDNGDDAVDLDGPAEAIIENNIIRNNGDDGIEIRLEPYSGTTLNIIIRGNIISGNGEDGIQLIDYPELSDRFFLIEHNLIEDSAMAGLGLMDNAETAEDYRAASIPEPIHLFNNTFSGNDHGLSGGDNLIALNNLFVNSAQIGVKGLDGDSFAAYNLFWNNGTDYQDSNVDLATTLFADPLLDAEYHLLFGSPAIDAGTAYFEGQGQIVLDLPPTAYQGAAPDFGWFESDFEPDNQPPTVTITAPADGSMFMEGESIDFSGTANDAEDGDVTASLTWVSTLDGSIGSGGSFSRSDLSAGTHTITATATDSGELTGFDSVAIIVLANTNVLVGAGDIASCYYERDEETAKLLDNTPGIVFTLGDNVYPDGTEPQFNECYDPTWGRHKTRTRPSAGNHDYNTPGASAYFDYFGAAAGEVGKGYYSYNVGDWHIIVLNSQCSAVGGCDSASPQGQWLQADLAANPSTCTLAYWHRPRFASDTVHGNNPDMEDFWALLYEAGADVVLNGHSHNYERFAPQDPYGVADASHGIREFIVGTGGGSLYSFADIQPNSEVRESTTWGVLKLTLHPTSYEWEFIPIAGQTFTDSGTANCVDLGNDAPLAEDDAYNTDEDTQATFDVAANDTDPDGNLDATSTNTGCATCTSPANGNLTNHANGTFTYTPNSDFSGSDSFVYEICDSGSPSLCDTANVAITVEPVNDPPLAENDSYSTDEDIALNMAAPGVLGNDNDVDGDMLTASLIDDVSHGSLTLNDDGSFSYTPEPGFVGSDGFTYQASDGSLDSDVATVSLTVIPINDAPVTANDAYSTDEDTPLSVAAPGVLGNDNDVDGDPLTANLVGDVSHGSLTLNDDGSFSYTPEANYNGPDSFTYQANDGWADSNLATVSLTVSAANDAPVAADNAYSTDEDTPLSVPAPGVLGNDNDVDGDPLTASLVGDVSHGSLTLNDDGSFSYTPEANYSGPDGFTYQASDGPADSDPATVSLTVNAVNDAPVAADNAYSTAEDTPLSVAAPGVLGNDNDVDEDPLTASLVDDVSHGSLTLNDDGSFSYTPEADYSGPDSFTYQASDGPADSNPATVNLTVTPVNDAPVAADDSGTVAQGGTLDEAAPGVLGNDNDPENDPLAVSATPITQPANGTVTLYADGAYTYVHDGSETVSDSFVYAVCDTGSLCDTATVNLAITAGTVITSLAPGDDAMVTSKRPTDNYGASTSLELRSQSQETIHSYLKFNVTGMNGTITSAKIRLYADKATSEGGAIYVVSNDYRTPDRGPWAEEDLTWENAPSLDGAPLSTVGAVASATWVEFDVTAAIQGEGVYSFGLGTNSSNRAAYRSKEAAEYQPVLIIGFGSDSQAFPLDAKPSRRSHLRFM